MSFSSSSKSVRFQLHNSLDHSGGVCSEERTQTNLSLNSLRIRPFIFPRTDASHQTHFSVSSVSPPSGAVGEHTAPSLGSRTEIAGSDSMCRRQHNVDPPCNHRTYHYHCGSFTQFNSESKAAVFCASASSSTNLKSFGLEGECKSTHHIARMSCAYDIDACSAARTGAPRVMFPLRMLSTRDAALHDRLQHERRTCCRFGSAVEGRCPCELSLR